MSPTVLPQLIMLNVFCNLLFHSYSSFCIFYLLHRLMLFTGDCVAFLHKVLLANFNLHLCQFDQVHLQMISTSVAQLDHCTCVFEISGRFF